jgi:PPK2 family polyphosphate:nucleotide phosphotransferase
MGKLKESDSQSGKMDKKEIIAEVRRLAARYSVKDGKKFRLKDYPTEQESGLFNGDKNAAQETLQIGVQAIDALQGKLYAADKWSLLLIFQAMDGAGKDSTIKHVLSGVNPQGCQVYSYKAPNAEELDHDYLWRCIKNLPERGRIGVFNRSYYEEVLVVRIHDQILKSQKLPDSLVNKDIWDNRMKDIRHFEEYLYRNGTLVIKFFLHISKEEQKKRFIERIDNPDKNWKFSEADVSERAFWDRYMKAYENLIRNTSSEKSPWYVIPADNKPFARILVASAIINAMDSLELNYPVLSKEQVAELQKLKVELLAKK